MHIILNNSSMIPIYEQMINQIKGMIIEGTLEAGSALPSVRSLSASLRISALTVKKAYDRLEELGFVVTVHGKGTYVAETDKQLAIEARRKSIEDELLQVIEKGRSIGLTNEEIREMIDILMMEG